jgi:hypothetical protein
MPMENLGSDGEIRYLEEPHLLPSVSTNIRVRVTYRAAPAAFLIYPHHKFEVVGLGIARPVLILGYLGSQRRIYKTI